MRAHRPLRIACVGHAAVDHVFEVERLAGAPSKTLARRYTRMPGGMSLNASIAAARLGASVRMIGRVGDDAAAAFLRERLADEGVEPRGLASVPGTSTSLASVVVDAQGERQIVVSRGDALTRAHVLDTRLLDGADAVLADPRWPEGAAAALAWARNNDVMSVLDADVAPHAVLANLVPLAQWVAFSRDGLSLWSRGRSIDDALRAASAEGGALVTLGAEGVRWLARGGRAIERASAPRVIARDTTAAGDVFHAAFALAMAQRRGTRASIEWACAAAAYKCESGLGNDGAPTAAALTTWLARRAKDSGAGA